jgi:hypothetical protein
MADIAGIPDSKFVTAHALFRFPHDHPAEPVLVMFDDGRWEIAHIGDADFIAENDEAFVNYVPFVQILRDADTFINKMAADELAAVNAKDVL